MAPSITPSGLSCRNSNGGCLVFNKRFLGKQDEEGNQTKEEEEEPFISFEQRIVICVRLHEGLSAFKCLNFVSLKL